MAVDVTLRASFNYSYHQGKRFLSNNFRNEIAKTETNNATINNQQCYNQQLSTDRKIATLASILGAEIN